MQLPRILAGPILRLCHAREINIWIASSQREGVIHATLWYYRGRVNPDVGATEIARQPVDIEVTSDEIRVSDKFYAYLVRIRPNHGSFPSGVLLHYTLDILEPDLVGKLVYPGLEYPTIVLSEGHGRFAAIYGSCRKPHGAGQDASRAGDARLAATATDLSKRPSVLLLCGDQIYADDVPSTISDYLRKFGQDLMGGTESLPKIGQSRKGVERKLKDGGFTSDHLEHHLLSFGEFAAAYLMAWNPGVWDTSTKSNYPEYLAGSAALRRMMANLPTYMMFDDHEITDDWNIHESWKKAVNKKSPLTRRVVANGMAAFWVFQAIGNDPEEWLSHPTNFKEKLARHVKASVMSPAAKGLHSDSITFDHLAVGMKNFTFATPTSPPVVFVDTRTMRDPKGPRRHRSYERWMSHDKLAPNIPIASRLIGAKGLRWLDGFLSQKVGRRRRAIFVTGTPVFGFEIAEAAAATAAAMPFINPHGPDPESFSADAFSFIDFLQMILPNSSKRRLDLAIILSGDVHYSFSKAVSVIELSKNFHVAVAQFTSSAIKNKPTGGDAFKLLLANKVSFDLALARAWWKRQEQGVDSSDTIASGGLFRKKSADISLDEPALKWAQNRIGPIPSDGAYMVASKYADIGGQITLSSTSMGFLEVNGMQVTNEFLTWNGGVKAVGKTVWGKTKGTAHWPINVR